MKFATIYFPGTIKDIRLYFKIDSSSESFLDMDQRNKILVKQSYMLLVWLYYLVQQFPSTQNRIATNSPRDTGYKIPKFFIYPKDNYKITVQKAPMAHKTFSQEQYMIRYYVMSISFSIPLSGNNTVIYPIRSINGSIYYALSTLNGLPYFSTNLLWLKRYSLTFLVSDPNFFSYSKFTNGRGIRN